MTIVLSIGAFINFLVMIVGVPLVLWKEKPKGASGLVWWLIVALPVAVFALVFLVTALLLTTSAWTLGQFHLLLAVVLTLVMFFRRGARTQS